jgi:hypothetical protein
MARLRATASAARSVLDGREHGGTLGRVGEPIHRDPTIKKRTQTAIKNRDHAHLRVALTGARSSSANDPGQVELPAFIASTIVVRRTTQAIKPRRAIEMRRGPYRPKRGQHPPVLALGPAPTPRCWPVLRASGRFWWWQWPGLILPPESVHH